MKASPRTSIVLVTTLLAGGVVAGSVSQDVLKPSNSGFLGTAESFFSPLNVSPTQAVNTADPGSAEVREPIAVAESRKPSPSSNAPVTGEIRLAVEPSVPASPIPITQPEPAVTPEPTAVIEPSPQPSVSPSSSEGETLELDGESAS